MAPHSHACRVILMALLCGTVSAQEPELRKGLGGYVQDKTGQAWVGAEVHLFSRILPGNEWIGDPDHQVVLSGKRGRFSARVLPDREYLVWAVSQPKAGVYRCTEPRVGVVSGPIRLRERVDRLVQVQIRIGGDKHWKPPFRIKVTGAPSELALGDLRVGTPHEVFPLALDETGRGKIPRLPWPEVTVEIYDQRGIQLWAPMVSLSRTLRQARLTGGPGVATVGKAPREVIASIHDSVLVLPKPVSRRVQVTGAGAAPLAAMRLGQRIRGKFVLVSMSDAEGWLRTDLPIRQVTHWDRIFEVRGNTRLVLHKAGYEEMPVALPPDGPAIQPKKTKGLRGRLWIAPDQALAHTQLILYVTAHGQVHQPVLQKTDKNGRFSFPQRIRAAWMLVALLDAATRRRFARADGAPVSRTAILASHGWKTPPKEIQLDLSQLRRLEFDLIRPDLSPASFARLDGFRFKGFNAIPPMIQTRADRRGRVAILIGDCPQALFFAQDDEGYAAMSLKSYQGRTELVLTGLLRMTGVVQDKQGNPIPGSKVQLDSTYISLLSRKARNPLYALNMGFQLGHRFCGRSDADGRFSISVPAGAETVPLWITPAGTTERIQQTVEMDQSPKKDVRLVIR